MSDVMKKTTECPWQTDGSHIYGADPDRYLICQITSDSLLADRDAIVTAVNAYQPMLEALEEVDYYLDRHSYETEELEQIHKSIEAVIALAKGEAQ